MVAPKRGRGAKTQAAKAKSETNVESETQETSEPTQAAENPPEVAETNNGDSEQQEHTEEKPIEGTAEVHADGESEPVSTEQKPEEKKEEQEPGKLLVENLPPSYLFDYQEKLKELFSKHGEITSVKRGPIIVTELTTTPTLSAIVEFKNKESMQKALVEGGTMIEGKKLAVSVEMKADVSVLVGLPHEASLDYVRLLFSECGEVVAVQEYNKSKFKTLRVTFADRDSVERAVKLDRELRLNGFLVTVTRYRDDDDQRAPHSAKNKRQHQPTPRPNAPTGGAGAGAGGPAGGGPSAPRINNYRGRGGGGGGGGGFATRANFRGGRGRGFAARGGAFPRGGFGGAINSYMPHAPYMARPVQPLFTSFDAL